MSDHLIAADQAHDRGRAKESGRVHRYGLRESLKSALNKNSRQYGLLAEIKDITHMISSQTDKRAI